MCCHSNAQFFNVRQNQRHECLQIGLRARNNSESTRQQDPQHKPYARQTSRNHGTQYRGTPRADSAGNPLATSKRWAGVVAILWFEGYHMVYAERRHSDLSGNGLYELAAILRAKGALAEPLQPAYSCVPIPWSANGQRTIEGQTAKRWRMKLESGHHRRQAAVTTLCPAVDMMLDPRR